MAKGGVVTVLPSALGVVAFVGVVVKAWTDVCWSWDVWDYHLPFAARLWGLVGPDAFVFHAVNQARFDGFPLLGEVLQGFLWRTTGRPEAANLLGVVALGAFAVFLRRRFAVPVGLALLALLAVPLVQTHAASAYVNLPANAALAALLLLALDVAARDRAATGPELAAGAALAVTTANIKLLLVPFAAAGLAWLVVPAIARETRQARETRETREPRFPVRKALACGAAFVAVFATPLKNLVLHGNPAYPVALTVLGRTLPFGELPDTSAPPHLADRSPFVRFFHSVLELGIQPYGEPHRWTLDQYMPPDSTGHRMGGFFGVYVVASLAAFVGLLAAAWRTPELRRDAKAAAGLFGALTVATALMPQGHQLRYYMVWMIMLVALDLVVLERFAKVATSEGARGRAKVVRGVHGALCVVAFTVVVASTRGAYVLPERYGFDRLLRDKVDGATLDGIGDGERVCFYREPWTFLYAARFHEGRRYRVREAMTGDACDGDRFLGIGAMP